MSDVKGWSPEYQSILETFDMINNKYENPDVSKDLHICIVNAWNNNITPSEGSTRASSFTWNTPLNPNIANNVSIEIYTGFSDYSISIIDFNNISNFLHIYNNEKKDRMLKIFQIPKLSNYNETEKPKRMEMGYYCKDKKEFKTLFNNQSFTNGKHVYSDKSNSYYMLYNGKLSTMIEPLTVGHLLTLRKNEFYNKTSGNQTLRYRYFKTIKNYLSNISDKYTLEFNNSYDNDYLGGGLLAKLDYNERLYNFNHFLQTCGIKDMFGVGKYFEEHYNKYDGKNKEFTDRILRGELVTSTEMNEIINIPHTLADGTESYYTFAESFAHHCGWYTQNAIMPKTFVISDITWVDTYAYPKYITLHDDYIC